MVVDIFNTDKKYGLLYVDPPWKQTKGGSRKVRPKQGKDFDYPVCSLDEIQEHLKVASNLTTENSILFLWTIEKYLFQAEEIAKNLGYKLHARMIWNKLNGVAPAFTVRFGHEYLLYLYRGKMIPIEKIERGKILTVFEEPSKKHSQKPEIAYQIIERLYPNLPKLEMYARNTRDGWDCWGNEV